MSLYAIPCVLFAGGKSSRMGEDKAFLPFCEHDSLIKYQVERLKEIFSRVYISAKNEDKFKDLDAIVIKDVLYNDISAPTTGFLNIFRQLKTENAFFAISVDTPFVNKVIIDKLIQAKGSDSEAVIVRTPSGIHPLCGIYTHELEEPMKEMMESGDHKITKLLKRSNVVYVDVEDDDLLLNLNTPDEYQKALRLLDQ